jgi:carbon starvation protein
MIGALCILAIGYRYYSAFIAAKVMAFDDTRKTPAHLYYDGHNYYPMNRWVLFGHHFAAIAGAGPLIGPVLAAQFGFLPGFLWILMGVVLGGAVQDFIILFASVRRGGKSLAEIARTEIGPTAGLATALSILFIVIIALAGLGIAVVNALKHSAWGTFTIGFTIPLAMAMGVYMFRWRKSGHPILEASLAGVVGLVLAVILGEKVAGSPLARYFIFDHKDLTILLAVYGFFASVLPVWLLLSPRDYLSSFMKLGVLFLLVIGILIVNPPLHMPLVSMFAGGGGPIVPGKLFPFVFITIACGAISGFHSLVSSGTTPKMIDRESHIRPIGYGAMLFEGLVGITSLIAASALYPGDYFHINVDPSRFDFLKTLGLDPVHLDELSREVGENVAGRTGGAVSLAVGMAQIFSRIPGLTNIMSYWYHFAIMFEALFILTTIDAGTRIARFILQEFFGKIYKPLEHPHHPVGNLLGSFLVVFAWGYFIYTGSISTIWPMFGIANQLLAVVALAVGTTIIINMGKVRYAWITLLPMLWVASVTLSAGYLSIVDNFLPLARTKNPFQGYLNATLTATMMALVVVILSNSFMRWSRVLLRRAVPEDYPEMVRGSK